MLSAPGTRPMTGVFCSVFICRERVCGCRVQAITLGRTRTNSDRKNKYLYIMTVISSYYHSQVTRVSSMAIDKKKKNILSAAITFRFSCHKCTIVFLKRQQQMPTNVVSFKYCLTTFAIICYLLVVCVVC